MVRQVPDVNCQYGAPMGRRSYHDAARGRSDAAPIKMRLQRLRFVDGCYDEGGAYWGGPANVWRAWADDQNIEFYFRAANREAAKDQVRAEYPTARFYR